MNFGVISQEKLTGNILAQVNLKCTLSMLKISGKALLEMFRYLYWKRDAYSYQIQWSSNDILCACITRTKIYTLSLKKSVCFSCLNSLMEIIEESFTHH